MNLDKFGHTNAVANKRTTQLLTRMPFTFPVDDNVDYENIKLCNLKNTTSDADTIDKKYVDQAIQTYNELVETGSTKFQKNSKWKLQYTSQMNGPTNTAL